jgi:hydroxymethylglutaryl-CoA reductase
LEVLRQPSAQQLMSIVAAMGLAQNFAAVRSLVTTGIQKGHMKMHLMNILNHLEASEQEAHWIAQQFTDQAVSFSAVRDQLAELRQKAVDAPIENGAIAKIKNR